MKKLIALLLCLLMVIGMVACAKVENDTARRDEENVEKGLENASNINIVITGGDSSKEKPYEGETLTFWSSYEEGTPMWEVANAYIDRFEEYTGATIEVKHQGRDLQTLLYPALDAGEDIDVFSVASTIQLELQQDHALNLNPYVEKSDILERAYPITMELIKGVSENDDIYYGIPTVCSFNAFWFNRDIFDAAGITELPETIEEFEAACDAIVAAGYYPMAQDDAYILNHFGALCERTVGEDIIGELTLNGGFAENERFVAACDKIIEWTEKGYFEPDAPGVWPASQNRIGLMKDTAMVFSGMWIPGEVEGACEEILNWGCLKFPYDPTCEEGTYGITVTSNCNMINKNTENPDLAWDFMYYMSTGQADKDLTDTKNYLVDDMKMEPLPRFKEAMEIMKTTTEVTDYAGGLHDNIDIKTSIKEVTVNLYAGAYATGLEAAQAFDALLK